MEGLKLDLRIVKTRGALTAALYDLLCEKSLDEITVTELCDRAMIRKATFYKHFADKTELLVYMIQELQRISEEENTIGYDPEIPQSYYIGVFRYFMDFIDSNERFITSVLNSSASLAVIRILEGQIRAGIDSHLRSANAKTVSNRHGMLAAFYSGAVIDCAIWWVCQEQRPDKEKVVQEFESIIMSIKI